MIHFLRNETELLCPSLSSRVRKQKQHLQQQQLVLDSNIETIDPEIPIVTGVLLENDLDHSDDGDNVLMGE